VSITRLASARVSAWSDDVDDHMRDRLLRMIEWHALARGRDAVDTEARGSERWVPDDVADQLPATFAAYDNALVAGSLMRGHGPSAASGVRSPSVGALAYPDSEDAAIEAWVRPRLEEMGRQA
jgi:hypothetical protein